VTFPRDELVHPFDTFTPRPDDPGAIDGRRLERSEVLGTVDQICSAFALQTPQVYVSPRPGHAHSTGAVRICESSLADLARDELEALLAHVCGHLVLPSHPGELSADRVAALYQGNADAITRVIFAEAVHSGGPDHTVRVREIQAWTATPGFARLAGLVRFGA
jgi:hypothetical protein